ncbi:MAG TPA: Fic family protein [Gaiellaceae bacterium]|nr:Fic family protein [Gaiellaceae bacterium]
MTSLNRLSLSREIADARELVVQIHDVKKNSMFLVMNPDNYQAPALGSAIRVGRGESAYFAFAPRPVPRQVDLSSGTIFELSEADRAVGALAGLGARLPNPHLLIEPYLRREAVASTRIEGTQSSLSDVLSAEAQLKVETSDQREVLNYVRALEAGLARLESLPLSKRLIREMHAELMRGVRGHEGDPGEFRRTQNWIGGTNPTNAVFVPPPVDLLEDALDDLEQFFHEDLRLPILVRCALAHYQFETIHPFIDGNGRLGRLLIVFYLVEQRVLRQPLLYLSAYFERQRDAYVAHLQSVRERGELDAWLAFFLRGVTEQAGGAVETAEALLRLRDGFRERLRLIKARGQAIDAAEGLIGNPFVTRPRLAQRLGVTRQGAQYIIGALERAGIITPVADGRRPALYVAGEILDVLQRG